MYYVPQMQQRYTGYDWGTRTARNLLDAVRMKRDHEYRQSQMKIQDDLLDMERKQREANLLAAGEREKAATYGRKLSEWEDKREKFANEKEAKDWDFSLYGWGTKDEDDYRREFEKANPAPVMKYEPLAPKFGDIGALPNRFVPSVFTTDTPRLPTKRQTLNTLMSQGVGYDPNYTNLLDITQGE